MSELDEEREAPFTPEQEAWIMPMMYERVWMYRRIWHPIDMLTRPIAPPVEPPAGTEDAAPAGKKKKSQRGRKEGTP